MTDCLNMTKEGVCMKKALSLALSLIVLLTLTACAGKPETSAKPSVPASPSAPETPAISNTPAVSDVRYAVRVGFLKGPTGIGASYLMEQSEKGETALDYTFRIESDPSIMTGEIIAGNIDIAAVPTNVAAVLFNKTGGNVKIIAINTLGVLSILENGSSITSVADLKGRTIYATGQAANPEYVLNFILRQNGLEPGKDVNIEFMDAGELATKAASGSVDLCMLPVPNATSVLMKNPDVRVALNLGEEWKKVANGSELTQGCVVIRGDLPNADAIVGIFLKEYETSVKYMAAEEKLDAAAALAYKYGIVASEQIAKAAIPDCGLTFITGVSGIKGAISGYFDVLFKADPKALGGKIPDDTFYFNGS